MPLLYFFETSVEHGGMPHKDLYKLWAEHAKSSCKWNDEQFMKYSFKVSTKSFCVKSLLECTVYLSDETCKLKALSHGDDDCSALTLKNNPGPVKAFTDPHYPKTFLEPWNHDLKHSTRLHKRKKFNANWIDYHQFPSFFWIAYIVRGQAKRYNLRYGIERYFSLVPKGLSYPYAFNTALNRLWRSWREEERVEVACVQTSPLPQREGDVCTQASVEENEWMRMNAAAVHGL